MTSQHFSLLKQDPVETEDVSKGLYGNLPMIQSVKKLDTEFLDVKDLTPSQADRKVWVRARLQTSRAKGWCVN
jgi:aspartyl-tRNA synthetase